MNTSDLLTGWSSLPPEDIEACLVAGTDDEAVERLSEADELAKLWTLTETSQARGLRGALVLLPRCMGSLLRSIRDVTVLLWINPALFLKGQCSDLELNQDSTGDATPHIDSRFLCSEYDVAWVCSALVGAQLGRLPRLTFVSTPPLVFAPEA